jgi:hypothetical protein
MGGANQYRLRSNAGSHIEGLYGHAKVVGSDGNVTGLLTLEAKVHSVSLWRAIGFQPGITRVTEDHHRIGVGGGKIRGTHRVFQDSLVAAPRQFSRSQPR